MTAVAGLNLIDAGKYVDIFGFGDEEERANSKINEMLDMIEKLYSKDSMPDIMQIMVHSADCPHCQKSLPVWEKLVYALEIRLRKYTHATIEMGDEINLGSTKVSGIDLYTKFQPNGVPFFLQNFTIETVIKNNNMTIKNLKPSRFDLISVGELQPFNFLATAFDIPNSYIEWKYPDAKSR